MITVINNCNESVEMYEGMSLSEAASQFVLEANQLVNEFTMDLLLTEHQYLAENGKAIEYVTEGDANDNGLGLLDKVKNLVENAKTLILKITNNIISFITEKATQVIAAFRKIGMDKAKVSKAFENHGAEELSVPAVIADSTSFEDITKKANEHFLKADSIEGKDSDNFYSKAGVFFDELDDAKFFDDTKVAAKDVKDKVITIIFNSDKLVKEVKKNYKSATDSLEAAKKRLASKKTLDAETIKDRLDTLRAGIMNNTYIMRDMAKVYSIVMKSAIDAAKDMINAGKGDKKEEKKEGKAADTAAVEKPSIFAKDKNAEKKNLNTKLSVAKSMGRKVETVAHKGEKPQEVKYKKDLTPDNDESAEDWQEELRNSGTVNASYLNNENLDALREACEMVLSALSEQNQEDEDEGKFFRV